MSTSIEECQDFPKDRLLKGNLNKSLSYLKERVARAENAKAARSYIVETVKIIKLDGTSLGFQQRGCGPNFQGGCLTPVSDRLPATEGRPGPGEGWRRKSTIS
ncbi:MAG: hypothetical protein ABR915_17320 [Thermoguttaceae bacterium]|jgi:hypothetical protein